MDAPFHGAVKRLLARARHGRVHELSRGKRAVVVTARVLRRAWHGFFRHNDLMRASALTYLSALSIVPSLAFAFALLKGLGGYEILVDRTLRPYIERTFAQNPPLQHALEQVLVFVGRTSMSSVGAVGLLFLVFSAVSLIANIEGSLNEIWGVPHGRTLVRRLADYIALIVMTPVLVVAAITTSTAGASARILAFLRHTLGLGQVIDFALRFTSVFVVFVAFTLMYVMLPNTSVRRRSALLGGLVAAILWQVVFVLYVRFQLGVSGYNALYSSLAAVPVFLVWMYASSVVVLLGAELAASHQLEHAIRSGRRVELLDEALRERLALAAMGLVTRSFMNGTRPWSVAQLAERLDVGPDAVLGVMAALESAGLVASQGHLSEREFLPRRDPWRLRAHEVVAAVRHATPAGELVEDASLPVGEGGEIVRRWEEAFTTGPHDVSIVRLAEEMRPEHVEEPERHDGSRAPPAKAD